MNRRTFIASAAAVATLPLASIATLGCGAAKTTLAVLVNSLGNAISAVYGVLGNTTVATAIKTDTDKAVAAINAWVPGTPAQDVIQVLNVLIQDLSAIVPGIGGTAATLISLAISTVEELLADFGVTAPLTLDAVKLAAATGKYPSEGTLRSIHSSFKSEWKRKATSSQFSGIVVE